MDRLSLIAMVFFASLVSPRPVAACTCEPFATPLEGLEFADVVFHGEVREDRASEDRRRTLWEFDVVAVWKGILTESVVVASPDRDAEVDCFFRFDRGGEYIVYALRDADGFLIADLCSRTALFDPQEAEGLGAPIAEFGHERVPFVRGDVNADGSVDISDAVWSLNWLFSAGPEPSCIKTHDVNGDHQRDITDPIYLLSSLFLGGPPPVAPFAECGVNELGEPFSCLDYPPCMG